MPMFGAGYKGFGQRTASPMPGAELSAPDVSQLRAAPSFFGEGGVGRNIAGFIGDALLSVGGQAPVYAPFQAQRRQQAYNEQLRQRQRVEANEDWAARQDYERANPAPQEPNALERNRVYLNSVTPGLGDQYAQNFANNGGGAPQITNVPGVGVVAVPRGGQPSGGGVPYAAVSYLRSNPGMAAQFDAKYGQGASARYLGGAAPQAPAPFPIR